MTTSTQFSRSPETVSGVVTTWLPLSTVYPSPDGCGSAFYSDTPSIVAAFDPGYGLNVNSNLRCQPEQVTMWWNLQPLVDRYSIGPIVCPAAYTTASISIKDATSTHIACCPSGYSLDNGLGFLEAGMTGECTTVIEAGEVITYGFHTIFGGTTSMQTISTATTAVGIQVNGWIFAQDMIFEANATGSGASPTQTSASGVTSSGNSNMNSGQGLSAGAAAGVGIGAGLGVLLILGLLAYIFWRRGHRNRGQFGHHTTPQRPSDLQTELWSQPIRELGHKSPLGRTAGELP